MILAYFRLAPSTLWLFNEKFSIMFDKPIIHHTDEATKSHATSRLINSAESQ